MDWSGDGKWTSTHAARQAESGHGTAVATAVLGSGMRAAGDGRAGAGSWGSWRKLKGGGGVGGGGGGGGGGLME